MADENPPYLEGKGVGFMTVAGGTWGVNTVTAMTHVAMALRAFILPRAVTVPSSAFNTNGAIVDVYAQRLRLLGKEITELAERLRS